MFTVFVGRRFADFLQCAFDPIIAISKEWFNEAFGIFMRSKQIRFEDFEDLRELSRRLPRIKKLIAYVSWRQESVYALPRFTMCLRTIAPNLKGLHVYVVKAFAINVVTEFGATWILELRGLEYLHVIVEQDLTPYSAPFQSRYGGCAERLSNAIRGLIEKAKGT